LGAPLEATVTHLNALMCEALPIGRFVTAFVGMLAADDEGETSGVGDGEGTRGGANEIRYVSAGQAPILIVRADGTHEQRDATTLPLGVDPWAEVVPSESLRLEPGDAFILLSDGYYEYMNDDSRQLGTAGVIAAVRSAMRTTDGSAQAVIAALDAALGDHGA